MNVSCPECQSVFRVDPAKVTGANLRARCSICGGLIPIGASVRWADDFPNSTSRGDVAAGSRSSTSAARPTPATVAVPPKTAAIPVAARAATPAATPAVTASVAPLAGDAGAGRVPPFAPGRRLTPVTPAFGAPATPPSTLPSTLRPPTPAFVPSSPGGAFGGAIGAPVEEPRRATPVAPPYQATPVVSPRQVTPVAPPPREPTPMAPPRLPTPAAAQSLRDVAPQRSGAGSATPAASAAVTGSPAAGGAPPARRPINPFLSNDPNQKARRLARALVSDMVAYHPQKREEGARNGTLKQLFREEIKKSYEEYVEQVGREFAESTTHFQEALNDVLAGGKRIF